MYHTHNIFIHNTILIGTVLAVLLLAAIIATLIVFVIVTYHQHKLHHRNQETPQGNHHVSRVFFACMMYSITVVYEEPYDWAVSRLPQTEPVMEQCPAYGVLTK